MNYIVALLLLSSTLLLAKEEFNLESMKKYLTKENPYIYSALGKKYVSEEKLNYTRGVYNTTVVAKYDDKDYPVSSGTYYSAGLQKATESGIDLSAGYRYAYGTQEYNNIKTDKDGEFIVGAKIPLVSVLNRMDKRRLTVGLARLNVSKADLDYKESMRNFYFKLMSTYYTLLYEHDIVKLSGSLVQKRQEREAYMQKSVQEGNLPEVSLLEVRQQLINAKQSYISAQRVYENRVVAFVKYLNMSKEKFEFEYYLPLLPDALKSNFNMDEALQSALKNRPDIQMLNTEIEKLSLKNRDNERTKYPELNVGVYGVYDVHNESGFKVSVDMSFPLARGRYKSKNAEIKENIKLIDNAKSLQILELKADLLSVINSLQTLAQNILSSKDEIALLQKLEKLEKRKYTLGSSTLFVLNQRETQRVQAEKKLLRYKLEYQLYYQSYKRIINIQTF